MEIIQDRPRGSNCSGNIQGCQSFPGHGGNTASINAGFFEA
jgi:hypothetical protein